MRLGVVLLLLGLGTGCASVRGRAHYMELEPPTKEPGADWLMQQTALREKFEARRELPLDQAAKDVLLLVERYPAGTVRIRNDLHIQKDANYELIGGYDLYASGATTLWFADYSSTWRKVYCYPQVPLTWLTLGAWQLVVPLSWPCAAPARVDRNFAWNQVRHLAAAAGADTAIVELKVNGEEIVVAWGWLLKKKSGGTDVGRSSAGEGPGRTASREGEAEGRAARVSDRD